MKHRWISGLMAIAVAASLFTFIPAVQASSKGRLNTTLGLGAATAYTLLRGKTVPGLLLGAGTVYAYSRYRSAHNSERRNRYSRVRYYRTRSGQLRAYRYR
jgi:hypothetical protein